MELVLMGMWCFMMVVSVVWFSRLVVKMILLLFGW